MNRPTRSPAALVVLLLATPSLPAGPPAAPPNVTPTPSSTPSQRGASAQPNLKRTLTMELAPVTGTVDTPVLLYASLAGAWSGSEPDGFLVLFFVDQKQVCSGFAKGFPGVTCYWTATGPRGTKTLEARFPGNAAFAPAAVTEKIQIVGKGTLLGINLSPPGPVVPGTTLTFRGTLRRYVDRAPLPGQVVTVKANGAFAGKATTIYEEFTLSWKAPPGLRGDLHIEAEFAGDDTYSPTSTSRHYPVKPPDLD